MTGIRGFGDGDVEIKKEKAAKRFINKVFNKQTFKITVCGLVAAGVFCYILDPKTKSLIRAWIPWRNFLRSFGPFNPYAHDLFTSKLKEQVLSYKYQIAYDLTEDVDQMREIIFSINEKGSPELDDKLFGLFEKILDREEMDLKNINTIIPTLAMVIFVA